MKIIIVIIIAIVFFLLLGCIVSFIPKVDADLSQFPVYCLLITNDILLSRRTLLNFMSQTHECKHLIILNTQKQVVVDTHDTDVQKYIKMYPGTIERVIETDVSQYGVSFDELYQVAIDFVPDGHLWSMFLETDWRASNYVSTLLMTALENNADSVTLKHVISTNGYKVSSNVGFGDFLAKKSCGDKYKLFEKVDLSNPKHNIYLLDNNNKMYIRHGNVKGLCEKLGKVDSEYVGTILQSFYV